MTGKRLLLLNGTIARMEVGTSSRGRLPSVGSSGVRAFARAPAKVDMNDESNRSSNERTAPLALVHSSICSIPCFETFASVISFGIQSGLSSGAVCSHAQPS